MLRQLKNIYTNNRVKGSLDIATGNTLSGWAVIISKKSIPVRLNFFDENNELVATAIADKFREDLKEMFGVNCAFHIDLKEPIKSTKIIVKDETGRIVDSKPVQLDDRSEVINNVSEMMSDGLIGYIDNIEPNKISGWAHSTVGNKESLKIIIDNEAGEIIALGKADLFRSDLISYNSGKCGFILKTLRPIRTNEKLYLKDEYGNNIYQSEAEFEEADNIVISSNGISGQIESVEHGIIKGWAINSQNSDSAVVKILDDEGNEFGEGQPSIFRDDIINIPPGKHGFVLYLFGQIDSSVTKVNLEVNGNIVDEYKIENLNDDYGKLLFTGEFALAWKNVSKYPEDNSYKRNSLANILSSAVQQSAWLKIEQIVDCSTSDLELDLLHKQLTNLAINLSKEPKTVHCNLSVDRQLEILIKFSVREIELSPVDYKWHDEEIFNIINLFLFYRKYIDEDTFDTIDQFYFNGELTRHKSLFFELQDLVVNTPVIPSEKFLITETVEKLEQYFSSINTSIHHSLKYHFLMYLSTLSANIRGNDILKQNSQMLLRHFENFDYSYFAQRVNGLLIDIYYGLKATKSLLSILEKSLKLDLSSLIWSSRKLDTSIAETYDYLPLRLQKLAIDVLEIKLDQNRVTKVGAVLLANIEYGEILIGKLKPFRVKKIIDALLIYKEDSSVRKLINQLYKGSFDRGTIIDGYQDWVKYENLVEHGLYEQIGFSNESILSSIMRDYIGILIDNDLQVGNDIIFEDSGKDKSLFIEFSYSFISDGYKQYLIGEGKRRNINVAFDNELNSDYKLIVEDGYILTSKIFNALASGENSAMVYTDSEGNKAAKLYCTSHDSKFIKTSITSDYFYTQRKDRERFICDTIGILKTDNQEVAFKYFSDVITKFPESKLINVGKDSMYALSVDFKKLKDSSLTCFIVQRNEKARLEKWFDYYRNAGVDRFVVIDNYSDDDTLDYVLQQPDADVFSTPQPYSSSKYGVDWIDLLVRLYRNGKWCLVVDADEELRLNSTDNNLEKLTQYLDANNYDALYTPFIDVYPHGSFKSHPVEMKAYSNQEYYYDRKWYTINSSHGGYQSLLPTFQGGVRHRKFGLSSVVLNKIPLFKFNRSMVLREGVHWLSNCNPYFGEAQLLHHKYNCLFHDYVIRESKRGEHWNGAVEYKKYSEELSNNSSLSLFDSLISTFVK